MGEVEARPLWEICNLISDIEKKPGLYDLDKALMLVAQNFINEDFKNIGTDKLKINSTKEMGFIGGSLVAFKLQQSKTELEIIQQKQFILDSAIFNFGGAFGPLPSELYDEFVRNFRSGRKEQLDFLNIFVDRLVKLDFFFRKELSWRFGVKSNSSHPGLLFLNGFLTRDTVIKDVHKVPQSGLQSLKFKSRIHRHTVSAVNLMRILSEVFKTSVEIFQNQISWLKIPENELFPLSSVSGVGAKLGHNSNIGKYYLNSNSKIKICIKDLPLNIFAKLVHDEQFSIGLEQFFRGMFDRPTTVVIEMKPATLFEPILSNRNGENGLRLGRNSWLVSNTGKYEMGCITLKSHGMRR